MIPFLTVISDYIKVYFIFIEFIKINDLYVNYVMFFCLSCFIGPSNHHSQSTLRPPLPPPHNHTLSHHHSSANSLNKNSLTNRRNQIHAPAPPPNDLATTPESVQLQDSWVLNSNVPLETRYCRLHEPYILFINFLSNCQVD